MVFNHRAADKEFNGIAYIKRAVYMYIYQNRLVEIIGRSFH